MSGPTLYEDRSEGEQTALLLAGPIALGVVAGIALGINEIAYLVLSLVGIVGGYFAGLEHDSPREGFHRGLVGGLLFGVTILLTHGLTGKEAKAELPDPEILVVVITTVFGVVLGALGARSRRKREAR
ncbi:MAG: hypothetical protein AVDCRST_MAG30-136 [uncultured Solirubrobacteraceae bacterium]|uniref:Uncharacterized protein n=1 Tax=uncultured Solirubrobacteraceae bacterium TaxID=1162706 RepID=A0A6J4RE12_9ACTN|nr:MAG: hypothetical protein AVDCRST_MAG30-136 [uncultured Solirubrobacteraceae bacterium]